MEGLRQHYASLLTSGGHLALLFVGFQIDTPLGWAGTLAGIALFSFFAWLSTARRGRLISDTPTSQVASAAQGYVELFGQAKRSPDSTLIGRLTSLPCVWYRYLIERKRNDEKGYETVEQGSSEELFVLDDGSGVCYVDPDHAEILTRHKKVWVEGDHRYTEYRLSPSDTVYALGEFATVGGAASEFDVAGDVSALLAEWKRDPPRLLERFDLNRDGQVDLNEWALARRLARREVEKEHRNLRLQSGVHLMRCPGDGRLFLLSNWSPEELARKYVLWSGFHLLTFFAATGGAGYFALS